MENNNTVMIFTTDYFIEKFSAIPDHLWGVGSLGIHEGHEFAKKCVLGHCGMGVKDCSYAPTPEADALVKLFGGYSIDETLGEIKNYWCVYAINDGASEFLCYGDTPKDRILNKLYEIKQNAIVS